MRKPLLEIAETERYLLRQMTGTERLQFEARCLVRPDLQRNVDEQRRVLRLVRWYARDARRQQLMQIHTQLNADPVFRQTIRDIFQ